MSNGVELVNDTGSTLNQIADQVGNINSEMTEIVEAAKEQASSLESINSTISKMEKVTNENASMVEASSQITTNRAQKAAELNNQIAVFKVSSGGEAIVSQKVA